MTTATLPQKAIKAFRSAGATEEMMEAARLIFGSLPREAPGRPRMYKNSKEADHAYYVRKKARQQEYEKISEISSNNGHPMDAAPPGTGARVPSLKGLLVDAARWNVDLSADLEPIRQLMIRGCNLEADILPTVARTDQG
jgi:hypothetical protein